jgi:uncharacterized protein (DUF1015 family)
VVGHRYHPEIDAMIKKIRDTKRCFASWLTADGRKHKLWKIKYYCKIKVLFEESVHSMYILDGHHRFKAAS